MKLETYVTMLDNTETGIIYKSIYLIDAVHITVKALANEPESIGCCENGERGPVLPYLDFFGKSFIAFSAVAVPIWRFGFLN
uniref:Uncharacterized protein n=1 Tax=Glossina morsitans morsitans TaxID=37546 RepID=A0A1B0FG28_GLOMM